MRSVSLPQQCLKEQHKKIRNEHDALKWFLDLAEPKKDYYATSTYGYSNVTFWSRPLHLNQASNQHRVSTIPRHRWNSTANQRQIAILHNQPWQQAEHPKHKCIRWCQSCLLFHQSVHGQDCLWPTNLFWDLLRIAALHIMLSCSPPKICHWNTKFKIDFYRLLSRQSRVNGTIRAEVLSSPWQRNLMLLHHPPIAGHPGQCCVFKTLLCSFYWPHMATDVDQIVSACTSCNRNNSKYHHKRVLQRFQAYEQLDFVIMNIFRSFPMTTRVIQYTIDIIDCSRADSSHLNIQNNSHAYCESFY